MPFVRIELAVLSLRDGALSVLLARRQGPPYQGTWAMPGGVLRIDLDADLDAAAQRVAGERLGLAIPYLRQQGAVGGPGRDERAPWALSVVYRALLPIDAPAAMPGKRVEELRWVPVDQLASVGPMAFDHAELITQAAAALRAEVADLNLPAGIVPASFTLPELQGLCEALLGQTLDKVSFRRRVMQRDLVSALEGQQRGGAHRPAQLYSLQQQ